MKTKLMISKIIQQSIQQVLINFHKGSEAALFGCEWFSGHLEKIMWGEGGTLGRPLVSGLMMVVGVKPADWAARLIHDSTPG